MAEEFGPSGYAECKQGESQHAGAGSQGQLVQDEIMPINWAERAHRYGVKNRGDERGGSDAQGGGAAFGQSVLATANEIIGED